MSKFLNPVFTFCLLPIAYCLLPVVQSHADISRDFNTGVYLYKKGEYELAAKSFELILTKFPDDPRSDEVMFWYGESTYHMDKPDRAIGIYKKLATEHPRSKFAAKGLLSAGYACMKLGRYRDAASFFRGIAADTSVDRDLAVESKILMADCYLKDGDDREAEQALREILATPKLPADRRQEAEFDLGKLLIRTGRAEEAQRTFSQVAEKSGPKQTDALMALGDAAYAANKYRESIGWYEKIVKKGRSARADLRARAIYNTAWSYLALGESSRASAEFQRVLDDKASPDEIRGDAALRLAYLLRERGAAGASEEKVAVADTIARVSGQAKLKDEVLLFRAESAFLARAFDDALGFLAQVSEKGYRVLHLTGRIFFESGRAADAALYFERAAVAAPSRDAVNLCLFDMAQSHFTLGLFDTALVDLGRIKDPAAELQNRMAPFRAETLLSAGKHEEAAKQYRHLAETSTDSGQARRFRYYTALALFQSKNHAAAAKSLEIFPEVTLAETADSVAVDDIGAAALLLRADILAAQKKFDAARDMYGRAVRSARTASDESFYLAYTHLIDFDIAHDPGRILEHGEAFAGALKDTRTYTFMIERLYEARHFTNLLKYVRDIQKKFPEAADLYGRSLYYQMIAQSERRDLTAAVKSHEALVRWLAIHPSAELSDEADFWRASLAQSRADRSLARSAYLSYLDIHPKGKYAAEARFALGLLALDEGRAADAEREFMKLLAGKSESAVRAGQILANARYNLASVRILQDRYADAAELLESLSGLPAFQSDPAYLYKLGYVHVSLGNFSEAETHFRKVIGMRDAPAASMDNALYALFSMLYRSERYSELEADFKRHIGQIKDPTILARSKYLMGMTMFDGGRFLDAKAFFMSIRAPKDTELGVETLMRIADCDYNFKNYKSALERYAKISDDHPATRWGREALYASGLCKVKLGFPEGALTGFERFLQENPDEPLALDVAREAARLYMNLGNVDAAEQKLDFLEKRRVDGTFLEEIMRMRIRIWDARGDADKVLTLAKSYRGAYGPNAEVTMAAAESAIKLGRPQDALDAVEGFGSGALDTGVRAFMDFYRAESLRMLGRDGAVELYRQLSDCPDTEIRLSSRFRYGRFLLDQRNHAESRRLFVSIASDSASRLLPFFEESILNALFAAREGGEALELARIYPLFKADLTDEKDRIAAAEHHLWARLLLKDHRASLAAIEDLLALNLPQRRRTEVLLKAAQLNEAVDDPAKADAIYTGIMNNPSSPDDQRRQAESRKVQLAVSRGAAGRPVLEEYLASGAQGEWADRAAESLLSSAVDEKRYADIIRTVDLLQARASVVRPSARYAAAMARLALSDTLGALADFRKVADAQSSETFYAAWSAYRVGQEEWSEGRAAVAKKYLRQAWSGRVNLDAAASLNTYRRIAEILVESPDAAEIQAFLAEEAPAGISAEPRILKGLAAYLAGDYTSANLHFKDVAGSGEKIRKTYAESLKLSGDTAAAIAEYEILSEGRGPEASRAQMAAGALYDSIGRTEEGLIAYYKVLAAHESDTETELGAEALAAISRLYARLGDMEKSRNAAAEIIKKYPNSRPAKEAADLAE